MFSWRSVRNRCERCLALLLVRRPWGAMGGVMLDWVMATARPNLQQKSSCELRSEDHGTLRVSASWPTTSMGSQPIVQDNESTDPPLSRDGKI